jgi:hypothetical protein
MKGISMRKIIITIVSVIGLLLPLMWEAQGTLYVSNLGQTPTGSASIGSDAWVAQDFFTGTNASGYILNSVQLLMDTASGSPSGFDVSLYSSLRGEPNDLGNLVGSDPSAGGIFTYTDSGLTLSPSTDYFIVLTATTPVAQGAYNWSTVSASSTIGGEEWMIIPDIYSSGNGLSWQISRQYTFQIGIYATAVPEPSSSLLLLLGSGVFIYVRRAFRR